MTSQHLTDAARDVRWMSAGAAAIWLTTALGVLHPYYRDVGGQYLDALGLPHALMWAACAGELVLAGAVLRWRGSTAVTAVQLALVSGFTVILAAAQPMLLVHPFGVLSKNYPLLALVGATWLVRREGWTPRATWLLRGGMALVWVTEGLFPKLLFQQPMELAVVEGSALVPMDAGAFLVLLGVAQLASGVLALVLRGRPLRWLLGAQVAALVLLPLLVSWQAPELWFHPFGPLTKNLPLIAGTLVALWRS